MAADIRREWDIFDLMSTLAEKNDDGYSSLTPEAWTMLQIARL